MRRVQIPLALLVLGLALLASACGGSNEAAATETAAAPGTESTAADACAKDQLELVNPGQLTIATDNPAFPPWFQDVQAWFALLAMVGLGVVVLVYGVINPGVRPEQQVDPTVLEAILAAVVGFYFGARA